ncbi:IS630 transposase-related protein [Legionella santicrucis]|uniref:IS630 transposase-related protein n=1 Tax=Legionella santicrucis TaxID=45074 RepID=UPI00072FF83B
MSHTTEIREWVLAYIEEGGLIKTACKLFGVSRSSIQRWRLRKAIVGVLSPVERTNALFINLKKLKTRFIMLSAVSFFFLPILLILIL